MKRRPGIAYRRPEGDPSRFVIEAGDDPRVHVPERPDGGWLDCVADEDREGIRARFPNAELVTIDGAGHWVHADAPDALAEVVTDFLTEAAP